MRLHRVGAVGAMLAVLALGAVACGSGGGSSSSKTITVGSANFSENETLARIYGGALEKNGFKVTYQLKLGAREVIQPALESGKLDLVPEYVGNYLNFLDPSVQGLPLDQATSKLRDVAKAKKIDVLDPSEASDGDIIAVTKDFAGKNNLKSISDLSKVSGSLTLAGPSECQTRQTCYVGLKDKYGLSSLKFKATDSGGPITKAALDKGDVQVARLFSADSDIGAKYVELKDDKSFQLAGNIVPVVRADKVDDKLKSTLNKVSKALTTQKLIDINNATDVKKEDAKTAADAFLKDNKLS